jgi:hypothetical protein
MPGRVGRKAEQPTPGGGDLLDCVVVVDAVELAGLATNVDRAVRCHDDALGVVKAVGEHLQLIDANERFHGSPLLSSQA